MAQEPVVGDDGKPKVDDSGQPVLQNKMDDKTGDPVPEMKDGKPVPFILSYGGRRRDHAWIRSTPTIRRT